MHHTFAWRPAYFGTFGSSYPKENKSSSPDFLVRDICLKNYIRQVICLLTLLTAEPG